MRLIIVGGVAGGMSAATRARRLDEAADIVVLERGPHVSFANCGLPYFIGGVIEDRSRLLVQTPELLRRRFRLDVRTNNEVTSIDRKLKRVTVRDLRDGRTYEEPYDKLILALGAEPARPPVPGADDPAVHCLRNLDDMDRIAAAAQEALSSAGTGNAPRAVIIGGGFIGLEMAENLTARGLRVAIAEMLPQVMPALDPEMAEPVHGHLRQKGVALFLANALRAVQRRERGLAVLLEDGTALPRSFAILSTGVRPNAELARRAGLDVGASGGIKVNEHMRTSDPDVYAVGDAVEVRDYVTGRPTLVPLAGPANRQGRLAADNVCGQPSRFRGAQGTAIVKVFDLAVASTGANEKALKAAELPYEKVYIHPASHAGYYPGAAMMTLKLLFSTEDGRVLGAQIVGTEGVDKRIDVLATAIQARMTVYDLEEAELAYAPPYGAAKDPVNMAGFVAANCLRGDVDIVHADQLGLDAVILDVRSRAEYAEGHVPGALNVPVDELRQHLAELPAGKKLMVYCGVGLRAYVACRMLSQHGLKAANMPGGYVTFCQYHPELTPEGSGSPLDRELKTSFCSSPERL
jgi:NADPH-dependent 2,4-dienoyl-CoA reductase/sulfur reductase-like enzyme/rhodanese-related sulfurtransferase